MMLLEHDAKTLLAARGVRVPAGALVTRESDVAALAMAPPWIVKAQVPVGGRGKAGGVVRADSRGELASAVRHLLGATIKGHRVHACRVEAITAGAECYLGVSLDPARGRLRVLASADGGVEVEANAARGALGSAECARTPDAVLAAARRLAASLARPFGGAVAEAAARVVPAFFAYEATLVEINPLFVRDDGTWTAGDAKLVVDDNALVRQPAIAELVRRRAHDYPELALKLRDGFDFVVLDPDGDIALVTTGAGLSMQLVDELVERGFRPFNFCDIRTGGFRDDPSRLIQVFRRIAAAPSVRSVLINFFAGITDLGELAQVLLDALAAVPELKAPLTVRLIGNNLDGALAILRATAAPLTIETDLGAAMRLAMRAAGEDRA